MQQEKYSKDQKDEAVRLYEAGEKTSAIEAKTGVDRALLYYELQKRGIRKMRRPTVGTETVTTTQLMEQLSAAHREIGRLELEIERLQTENERLRLRARKARG